jgi:hypothetical protein
VAWFCRLTSSGGLYEPIVAIPPDWLPLVFDARVSWFRAQYYGATCFCGEKYVHSRSVRILSTHQC